MKLFIVLFALVYFVSGVLRADEVRFKNETIDAVQAMQAIGFDQSANANSPSNLNRFSAFNARIYYVIQFAGPILEEWKTQLQNSGVELDSFVPDNAFIVKIATAQAWDAVNRAPFVKALFPYKTSLRLSRRLKTPSVFRRGENQKVVLKLMNSAQPEGIKQLLQSLGANITDGLSERTVTVEVSVNKIADVADVEGVEWVEPAPVFHTMEYKFNGVGDWLKTNATVPDQNYKDLTGYESGTKLMNFDAAWNRGYHGEGETVALGDTGLDHGSTTNILADFQGQVTKGYAKGFLSHSWNDSEGHGTHTAGSVASLGTNSGGLIRGGAYGARLIEESLSMPFGIVAMVGLNLQDLFVSVHQKDGVNIHSDSWGSNSAGVYDSAAALVDDIMWKNPDLLLVFAAGNSGVDADGDGHIDPGSVDSPATAKNCLTVGASKNLILTGGMQKHMRDAKSGSWAAEPLASSTLSDNPNGMAPFSSIGPTQDGRLKPDIVAPGTNIVSTRSQDPKATPLWAPYNKYYAYAGGTSMSTPLTAGAAAITHQYAKKILGKNPSAAMVKAILIHNAHDLYPGQFGTGVGQELGSTRPNMNEGYGRVDMDAVTGAHFLIADERVGLKTGQGAKYSQGLENIPAGTKIRVTMAYTDAPGTASAAQALVNDLDLFVTDAQGKIYYPNHLSGPDHKNNVEMVEFDASISGAYTVYVKATNVPQPSTSGGQPFAIVWNTL